MGIFLSILALVLLTVRAIDHEQGGQMIKYKNAPKVCIHDGKMVDQHECIRSCRISVKNFYYDLDGTKEISGSCNINEECKCIFYRGELLFEQTLNDIEESFIKKHSWFWCKNFHNNVMKVDNTIQYKHPEPSKESCFNGGYTTSGDECLLGCKNLLKDKYSDYQCIRTGHCLCFMPPNFKHWSLYVRLDTLQLQRDNERKTGSSSALPLNRLAQAGPSHGRI